MTEVTDVPIFPGNRKRAQPSAVPPLKFGKMGELTPEAIEQANLSPEERERAEEMMAVQCAYLQLLDCLSYPIDPDGHVHDLNMMAPTRIAIAWTLALAGFRQSGQPHIKKRHFSAPGCYPDAHTWVDVREPDSAEQALLPDHKADDHSLPPDTRRLAAIRDGVPPMEMPEPWHTVPKIVRTAEPRGRE